MVEDHPNTLGQTMQKFGIFEFFEKSVIDAEKTFLLKISSKENAK